MKIFKTDRIIPRRNFLGQSITAMVGINVLGLSACVANSKDTLRVIAYNVLKCTGWPAENVKKSDSIPDLIAGELSKYSPGIVNFSESPDESVVKKIAEKLKMDYVYFPSGGKWPGAILTRCKIMDSENVPVVTGSRPDDLFTRHWGKATIQLMNRKSVIVHSVHLYPFDNPEAVEVRKREISEILNSMGKDVKDNKPIIVMGDLNHTPNTSEYLQWMTAGFADSFGEAGMGDGLTIRADMPTRRIDYILAYGPIVKHIAGSRALFEGAFRTNPEDPDSFALSDHIPQYTEFEI